MRKGIAILFVLAGLMAFCSAIVCTPNFCEIFKCHDVTEETCRSQNALFVPHGSVCGCCHKCVSLARERVNRDIPVKLCPLPFIGSSEPGYYFC
ncbi:uncharacterized protein [Halyomorpha halys]|uniref:uncharacterized protein n=1 Tax=Halyomorpha halys TaxID=286706 RepID=UPI0006D4E440|nr:fungal protease inhibitor-1-like [Halyomorpha halys]